MAAQDFGDPIGHHLAGQRHIVDAAMFGAAVGERMHIKLGLRA